MFEHWKSLKGVRGWYVWKLKLIDARLYFVSIFVGLLTGLIAVPYHYLLQFFFDIRSSPLVLAYYVVPCIMGNTYLCFLVSS